MNDSGMDVSYQVSRQKIILTGDVAVGKTSIINTLLGQKFNDEYEPSIGVDFFSKTMKFKGKIIKLQIWDSAGQEKFKSLIPNYIRGASLIFLVYDITNKKSFENLPNWVKFINNIENGNIVIVGNKTDLNNKREISTEEASKFCEENNFEFFEVSAKNGNGLYDMLFNSVANLPVFGLLNNEKLSKEEIVQCLQHENIDYNVVSENKRMNETVENGIELNENPNKDRAGGLGVENSISGIDKDLVTANKKQKKGCC